MGSQFITTKDLDSLVRKVSSSSPITPHPHFPNNSSQFFKAVDSLDAQSAIAFYASDCHAQFGNIENIRGAPQLQKLFDGFFSTLESLRHDVKSVSFGTVLHACVAPFALTLDVEAEG
jgi:hypothetical protein